MQANKLEDFPNLASFFIRSIKPECRRTDTSALLVCPCDGQIVYQGVVDTRNMTIAQVKGVNYSANEFLGGDIPTPSNPENELYYCVIYLAPGDYHRFHSPGDWTMKLRYHIPGELLSVNPGLVHLVEGVFNFNERVVLRGDWSPKGRENLFFSMTAVGATNVGSIQIKCDKVCSSRKSENLYSPCL